MKPVLFSLFGNASLLDAMQKYNKYEMREILFHQFPDEEVLVRIAADVNDRDVFFMARLDRPNSKILSLIFAAKTARDLGAKKVCLIAPYLPYMRQDKQFHPGEGVTSRYFATLVSSYFDGLITVDPHLHRRRALSEIFAIPAVVLHAIDSISQWIKEHIVQPILIGPDKESEQWVREIAEKIHAPFVILEKIRKGDFDVEVFIPTMERYRDHTPVLIDDIISTGRTMIKAVQHLKRQHMKLPICIAVHAVFANNAYQELISAGAGQVVTCNTLDHVSNAIDLSTLILGV